MHAPVWSRCRGRWPWAGLPMALAVWLAALTWPAAGDGAAQASPMAVADPGKTIRPPMSLWRYADGEGQAAQAVEPMVAMWTDPFDGPPLHSRWSWVREDPGHWSLSVLTGTLVLITQPDSLKAQNNTQHNLLLTAAPPGDYRITTHVQFAPAHNYQQAGLLIYQDDDNYLKLNRQFAGGQKVEMVGEIGGAPVYTDVDQDETRVYLQVRRNGDRYTGYYSLDRASWLPVGTFTAAFAEPRVGLHANHEVSGMIGTPAAFDFFQVESGFRSVFLPLVTKDLAGLPDLSGLTEREP